jgi:MoxR-like ATPase
MGYPEAAEDEIILSRFAERDPLDKLTSVLSSEELMEMQTTCRSVMVGPDIRQYIISLIHETRKHAQLELGASPRAMIGLFRTSQALAAVRGRTYVIPDDVKYLTAAALGHRIIARRESHLRGRTVAQILKEVQDLVPVPVETEPGIAAGQVT